MTMRIRGVEQLPVREIADEVNKALQTNNCLVITAAPGAGKSTLLPLTIHDAFGKEGKTIVLEPRRLAARQIAERVAWMLGEKVGETVGYRVRHDTKVCNKTRIEFITEGILTRMLVDDSTLEGVSTIIFDEFHERNINSDVALALSRETQQIIRPDLRIVIMSATINAQYICNSLNASHIYSEGRMYPVEIKHIGDEYKYSDSTCDDTMIVRTIMRAHREHEGDILVFLPGEGDIRRIQELLEGDSWGNNCEGDTNRNINYNVNGSHTKVLPLYSMLSAQEQKLAIAPSEEGTRKIVLATNIAETSITIEGVRVVIDTGLYKKMVNDPRTSLSHLETVRISMDMANQRSGRAGRVASGICYRLWNKAAEHRMEECRIPEIQEADLSSVLLDIATWGENNINDIQWITPPPQEHVKQAQSLLALLNAIDEKGKITNHGRELWKHPYHPRIAEMMVMAKRTGKLQLATKIAEILEAPPSSWPDHLSQDGAGALLAYAFPERIAMALNEGVGKFRLACGDTATVDVGSDLAMHNWIAIASMNASGNGKVFLGAPLHESDLKEHIKERDNVTWDNKQGCLVARKEWRIGCLLVDSRHLSAIDKDKITATICEAAHKLGTSMFDFNDNVLALQRRIATVASWHSELYLPNLDTSYILQKTEEWLPLYIGKATTTAELKKIDLTTVIWGMLSYEQQNEIDRIAPTHIVLPNGRRHKVEYRQGAELPIMRVRLQECFGMNDTPCVDNGKRPILMELLSPGFKPVQLTQDLRSFWNSTYFEVRKELRRRYPKHAWPESPFEAK